MECGTTSEWESYRESIVHHCAWPHFHMEGCGWRLDGWPQSPAGLYACAALHSVVCGTVLVESSSQSVDRRESDTPTDRGVRAASLRPLMFTVRPVCQCLCVLWVLCMVL